MFKRMGRFFLNRALFFERRKPMWHKRPLSLLMWVSYPMWWRVRALPWNLLVIIGDDWGQAVISLSESLHLLLVRILHLVVVLLVFLLLLKLMSPLLSTMAGGAVFSLSLGPWHRVQIIMKIRAHHLRKLVPLRSCVVIHFTAMVDRG